MQFRQQGRSLSALGMAVIQNVEALAWSATNVGIQERANVNCVNNED